MNKKEKIIVENKESLKNFNNLFEMNVWIISTFGMSALRSPQTLQTIYTLLEKHGIETFRLEK